MNEAERKYIARQHNYGRVPHPLPEGLVFVSFGPISAGDAVEAMQNMIRKIEENETAKLLGRTDE